MKKTSGKKKGVGISVDFKGVESGGRVLPDGKYTFVIDEVEEKEGNESGEPYLAFKLKVKDGKHKGAAVWDNASLQPQALWRLKGLLEACNVEVPDGEFEIETDDLIGEEFVGTILNETYQGKKKPRLISFGDEEAESEEEEEEEEEEKPARGKKKPVKDEEEEEEEKPARRRKPSKDEAEEEEEEEEEENDKKKSSKVRVKVGSKVKFEDEKGKTVKGTVTEIEEDVAKVEDARGDEWEIDIEELEIISK